MLFRSQVVAEGFVGGIFATNGVVSGSSQVDITATTNYSSFSSSVATSISASSAAAAASATWNSLSGKPAGIVSGSAQITLTAADYSGFSTSYVTEGSRLYYTDTRVENKVTNAYIQSTLTLIDGGTY